MDQFKWYDYIFLMVFIYSLAALVFAGDKIMIWAERSLKCMLFS